MKQQLTFGSTMYFVNKRQKRERERGAGELVGGQLRMTLMIDEIMQDVVIVRRRWLLGG